jgi:hypothetical protein
MIKMIVTLTEGGGLSLSTDPYQTIGPRTRQFLLEIELHKMGRCYISIASSIPWTKWEAYHLQAHGWDRPSIGIRIGASLPAAEGANSPMVEFLDTVAHL